MNVPCIKCGDCGCVTISVESPTCVCSNCDAEYGADEIRTVIAAWSRLLPWLEAHPARVKVEAKMSA